MKAMMSDRVVKKRTFNNIRGRLKKRIRNGAKLSCKIIKKYHLYDSRKTIHRQIDNNRKSRKVVEIFVPKVFSIFENPRESLKFLHNLKENLSNTKKAFDLFINHENTREISIDASSIFDKIINDYVKRWSIYKVQIKLSGICSKSREVNNFLLSFGFFSHIHIIAKQLCPKDADFDYKKQYIIFKKKGSAARPYLAGNACTELTDFFEKCFNENGFSIKGEAKVNLIDVFGEIIKNAEEHSASKEKEWMVVGCYSRKQHSCSFSIINPGRSFYDSLSSYESTASSVLSEINDILHKHRGVIEKLLSNKKMYEENIWTMITAVS